MQQSIYKPGFERFGGGSVHSVLHPLVLALVILIAILVFVLPRRWVIVPLILGIFLIPYGQNLYVAGFHMYMYRLLILLGWIRVVLSQSSSATEALPDSFNVLDRTFVIWATYTALAVVLLYQQTSAITSEFAFLWDALGGYFLFRWLIRSDEDILRIVRVLTVLAAVIAVAMLYEHWTARNFFAFLGGVRAVPDMREGRIRAQAVFGHSILAGCFGATIFPLFLWLWKSRKAWFLAGVGIASALVITIASSSSTPVMALFAGILVFCLWPVRKQMRSIRWAIVLGLIGLQMVMKAPIWFLSARIDFIGGGGWDRAKLIDTFIRHFSTWWLFGTRDYVNWGWDMWDACNQFVANGYAGGLIGLTCFIVLFCVCFRWIGNARKAVEDDRRREWLVWTFGATLFAELVADFGIDYFDQTSFLWYLLLAMICVVTLPRNASVKQSAEISTAISCRWNTRLTQPIQAEKQIYLPTRYPFNPK